MGKPRKNEHDKVTYRRTPKHSFVQSTLRHLSIGEQGPEATYCKLMRERNPMCVTKAGELAVEQALRAGDAMSGSQWLEKADKAFRLLELGAGRSRPITSPLAGIALLHLAQMPNYAAIASTSRLPHQNVGAKAFASTLLVAKRVEQGVRQKTLHRLELRGLLAEMNVLLLGQRYALREHPDQSWFPLMSHVSENHHNWDRHAYDSAWDVSVYTDLGEQALGYKIQVKSSKEGAGNRDYADDISLVCVNPDLAFAGERRPLEHIVGELLSEQQDNTAATYNLDARTEKLLDILG